MKILRKVPPKVHASLLVVNVVVIELVFLQNTHLTRLENSKAFPQKLLILLQKNPVITIHWILIETVVYSRLFDSAFFRATTIYREIKLRMLKWIIFLSSFYVLRNIEVKENKPKNFTFKLYQLTFISNKPQIRF